MAASNVKKLLDVLNNNETNIEKIAMVSHHFLLLTSMKNAHKIIQKKEAEGKIFNNEEKIKNNKKIVNLIYDKIKILKELLKH